MSRAFEVTRDLDLPARPDDVWTAMTAETDAWQFPTGLEIPAGAAPPEGSPVTTWQPPDLFVVRMEAPDGTFTSLRFATSARDGGTAHLHYVHSGILSDEWEDQYDAIGPHTDFYLHTLGEYLQHFRGRPVRYVGTPSAGIEAPPAAGGDDAMDTLRAALGLTGARRGDEVHATLGKAGALDGVVDYATPDFLGVRTADALVRFFGRNAFGGVVGMSAHVFGDGAAALTEPALEDWLAAVYA
ncbi:MAG TPA: hypothetical protein VE781_16645 [Kineosporiaceae bacterium]|nr:hypothetical protein [Kineosporiaceae bacterium]